MARKKIDLSDIKTKDFDETSSFTDLMSKKEKTHRSSDDIDDMIYEKRKNTEELTRELEKAKEEYNKQIKGEELNAKKQKEKNETEENLGKTQILELTRVMKFNLEEVKTENQSKKNGITLLNIIGIFNLLCIGFYIYMLTFTNYQDSQNNYLINGSIIVLLVLLFGMSVVSGKKLRKIFNILNVISILSFIGFNIYIFIY